MRWCTKIDKYEVCVSSALYHPSGLLHLLKNSLSSTDIIKNKDFASLFFLPIKIFLFFKHHHHRYRHHQYHIITISNTIVIITIIITIFTSIIIITIATVILWAA